MDPQNRGLRHIALIILTKLDNKSITKCRLVNKAWKSLIDSEKFYFIRQIIKFKTKYKSFFKAHVEWNGILGDFDSKQKLSDLKNMSRFLHEFFKMKNPEKYDPFEWIVSRNEINWVKFLLRFVKDLNQTSEVGSETNFKETTYNTESHEPAFFTACFEGYTEIVELLMNVSKDDKIIDYNWQDLGGRTPFQIACERYFFNYSGQAFKLTYFFLLF